jgi:hypothetical protein
MTDQHRATPEQWEVIGICKEEGKIPWPTATCILELRARIEALEAAHSEAPMTELRAASAEARPAGLVERVEEAIMNEDWLNNGLDESVCSDDDPNYRYTSTACNSGQSFHTLQARAAIREVIAAAKKADFIHASTLVHWLEQEADRG